MDDQENSNRVPILILVAGLLVLLLLAGVVVVAKSRRAESARRREQAAETARQAAAARPAASATPSAPAPVEESPVAIASRPPVFDKLSATRASLADKHRAFRVRQYLDAYKANGDRNPACDADSLNLIEHWLAVNNRDEDPASAALTELAAKLAGNPACQDPLVLTVAGVNAAYLREGTNLLVRAIHGFEGSKYKAYPKMYATLSLARILRDESEWVAALDASALQLLKDNFSDGSFRPDDQGDIADIFLAGWARAFLKRNEAKARQVVTDAGPNFNWLALLLEGEFEADEAWRARGNDDSRMVTETGWLGYKRHLAKARECLTTAWKLRPELPHAPAGMVGVALGDGGLTEMRLWFDRSTTAEFDYMPAWNEMRQGLRPRWYGNLSAGLAFGIMALNTARFDSFVPRQMLDAEADLEYDARESHLLAPGKYYYGRPEIWPHLQKMYEGYLATPGAAGNHDGWRDSYLRVAYFAGKYDVARKQLEAAHGELPHGTNWGCDTSLVAVEIAARTGSLGRTIDVAEGRRDAGDIAQSFQLYGELAKNNKADERTREFVRDRRFTLEREQRLDAGEWVDLLPADDQFTGWHTLAGDWKRLPDGTLEVKSGPEGHVLYCRVRQGADLEIRGTFQVLRSSSRQFQAGVMIGLPAADPSRWYGVRMVTGPRGRGSVSFTQGWSGRSIGARAPSLNGAGGATNAFLLHLAGGKLELTVNGENVLKGAQQPANRVMTAGEVLVGLGGYNDHNETTIVYSRLETRKLPAR